MAVGRAEGPEEWFARGPDVPDDLFPVRTPGPGAVAHALLQRAAPGNPGATEVAADDWITHEDSERYILKEDSRKVTDDLVLMLLWWEDERQILDLDDD
ncbi:MAG: hypothetical protein SCH98_11970 [Deferrisomatales bacterium]|nr:hypothetical protein [Deferrisomatales bacterium]